LYIDFEDILTIQSFMDSIRHKEHITLMEYLFDKKSLIQDTQNGCYVNQFIAPVFNTRTAYQPIIPHVRRDVKPRVDRSFFPGSRWLSYKLYCSPKAADEILLGSIYPLSEKLLASGLIKKWFFIRYNDSSHHLRVRFNLIRLSSRDEVMSMVLKSLSPFENNDMLWKLVVDTYFREIERYGEQTMDLTESLFFLDSSSTAQFLMSLTRADPAEIRWLWGVRAVDDLLNSFGLDTAARLFLLDGLKEAFAKEFQLNKRLKIEIDKKFRVYRKDIEAILTGDPKRNYLEGREYIIKERTSKTTALARKIKVWLEKSTRLTQDDLLGSYVHMALNRVLPDQQRASELVIYHLLADYYKGKSARSQGQAKLKQNN
jgi:lantibiotic biosynthesis protein